MRSPQRPGMLPWWILIHPELLNRWFRADWRRLIVFPILMAVIVLAVFSSGDLALVIMVVAMGLLLYGLAALIGPWGGRGRLIDTIPDDRE